MTPDTKEPRHPYERIYLVADDTELSWCEDRITPDDTEYVRADLFNRLTRELAEAKEINRRECEDWAKDHTDAQNFLRPFGIDVGDDEHVSLVEMVEQAASQLAARNAVIEKARAIRHLIVGSRGRFCSTECLGTCPECRAIAEFEAALAAGGT